MHQVIETPYLNSTEAAAYIRITPGVLANWRCTRRHEIPYVKVGSKVLYRRADLEKFMEDRAVNPGAKTAERNFPERS
jgi:excisionase family DNA binding protein